MHDAPTPHEPTSEAPHPHEAPGAPLIDHHVFSTVRLLLGEQGTYRRESGTRPREALDALEHWFKQLDWLAHLSRRSTTGEQGAAELLSTWLESRAHDNVAGRSPRSDGDHVAGFEHAAGAGEHAAYEGTVGDDGPGEPAFGRTLGLNVRAIRELFLGAVYAAGPDMEARIRNLDLVQTTVTRSVRLLDVLHHHAVRTLDGFEHAETVPNLLVDLPRGDNLSRFLTGHPLLEGPKLPPLLEINPILECLDVLREGTIGAESGFGQLEEARSDPANLTSLIARVSPAIVCAGRLVTLHSDPSDKFPKRLPRGYGVFVEPCGTPARIESWGADEVTIEIPVRATSGCVSIRQVASSESAATAQIAEHQAVETFAACTGKFGLGRPGLGAMSLDPTAFCLLTVCQAGNYLEVRHKPEIVSLVARDPAGRAIGSDGVEAGTPVTVSWSVASDDPGALQIAITGAKTLSGLPANGSLMLSDRDMGVPQSLTLEAVNSCGATTSDVTVPVFRNLSLSPDPLSLRADASGTLTIRSSWPVPADVNIAVAVSNPPGSSGPARVTAPATAKLPAGQARVSIPVAPAVAGGMAAYIASLKHGDPAAVVTATASSHTSASVAVWVEPPIGQANVSPVNTDVVAVHMALLRSGNVLMFSADDGHFGDIDKVKTRVWDPSTDAVGTPSFPYPTHKNLFCAGHCLLPDGRVLVVGGHAWFAGGSAAKMVHTYDPPLNRWSRHAAMQKDRWYPTCLTLADGRALISSGSEGGGPPSIKGVVRDVEIFDPATNGLTHFPNVHGDICMYPYMFVLPGNVLFFHSRNVSWLFAPGAGTWSPTNGNWSGDIPMKNPNTRTYPGMAGCALLPLLPEEEYAVRILMAGGGGARESNMSSNTIATRTAEILDVDVNANTGAWRTRTPWGLTLRMATPRFMSDAVLLPDGNVLFVNGAAVGKADDSHVSVGFAELFDPREETFTSFTPVSTPRHYHGSALLLPDGRVAVAGHTKEWNKPPVELNRKEIELISPPYLFRGPRPKITQIAFTGTRIGYGNDITISSDRPADIARVALVRPGSVTHQLNTDQRYVGLTVAQRTRGSLTAKAPPDGGVAPPGDYLVFIVDSKGVPSVGRSVPVG